jgi:hypothetical protein
MSPRTLTVSGPRFVFRSVSFFNTPTNSSQRSDT